MGGFSISCAEELIHLAVLLPGPQIAAAAELAVEKVNADKFLLPGYVLEQSRVQLGCIVRMSYFAEATTRYRTACD